MRTVKTIILGVFFLAILCVDVPEAEEYVNTPYMQVEHQAPHEHEVNVVLWGTDKINEEENTVSVNRENKDSEYTEQEILLLERVTMSEASLEPFDGKVMVAKTILNRSRLYGRSIEQVIYEPYQYSYSDNGKPTEEVKRAVVQAINDKELPDTMIYFKEGGYHSFGVPYMKLGRHYFSLSE